MTMKGKEYGLNKTAAATGSAGRTLRRVANAAKTLAKENPGKAVGATALAGVGLDKFIRKIRNDSRRKYLIEKLMRHDPIISDADSDEVMRYYATLYRIAPELSLDENAVKELLQSFIKFGRVDMATLKMLADTEKSLKQNQGPDVRLKDFV